MTWTRPRNRYRAVLLGLGCGLFAYVFVRLGPAKISSVLLGVGWSFGWIAATYFGHQLLRGIAYWRCITANGHSSYLDTLRIRLSGEAIQFLTFTGPFLSEPAKVWLLKKRGLRTKDAVAATVAEYLIYTLTSAVFALAGLIYLVRNFDLAKPVSVAAKILLYVISIFLLTAACAIVGRIYLIGLVIKGVSRLPLVHKRLHLDEKDVRDTEDLLLAVLRSRPLRLLSILAAEFGAQAFLVLELLLLLRTTGQPFSTLHPFLIEAASKFIGLAFFFIPGQVGAAEGAYALIFQAVGLSASAGFALAVARRIRSLLVAAAGLAVAPLWKDVPPGRGPAATSP